MEEILTLSKQDAKEFLKRPLGKVLSGISVFMDRIHRTENEMEFDSDDCHFVLTATKKEERDGNSKFSD